MHRLLQARVVLLLISEAAIEDIQNAHERNDNVLLEVMMLFIAYGLLLFNVAVWQWEIALRLHKAGLILLVPILLGTDTYQNTKPTTSWFNKFGCECYANERSNRFWEFDEAFAVRNIMEDIFKINGHNISPWTVNETCVAWELRGIV